MGVVEEFGLNEFSVKRFQTTPSGIAKEIKFYEKKGYVYIDGIEVAKNV